VPSRLGKRSGRGLIEATPELLSRHFLQPRLPERDERFKTKHTPAFVALEFDYPDATLEAEIIVKETGIDASMANQLVKFAHMTRDLKGSGLDEGASTRLLVHAAKLIHEDIAPVTACKTAISQALTDDADMLVAMNELSSSLF